MGLPHGGVGSRVFLCLPQAQAAPAADSDGNGIADWDEFATYRTNPAQADTDGDRYPDGIEVANGYSPRHDGRGRLADVDSDRDGLPDAWELALGTNLESADSDGDGFADGTEVANGYDPRSAQPKKLRKRIHVSLRDQRLTYTFDGVTLATFPISSGLPATPTPKGNFTILAKVPSKHYVGRGYNFSYPNTKWNLHFATGRGLRYYIHGAYWHNDFGRPKSHGCVNVSYADMERLYAFAQVGTTVTIE